MPGTNPQPEMLMPPMSIDVREATGLDALSLDELVERQTRIKTERVQKMLDWERLGFDLTDVETAIRRKGGRRG